MGMGKAESLWKDMFTKALASMRKLEKEITHQEREVQPLRSLVKGSKAVKVSTKTDKPAHVGREQRILVPMP